VTGLDKAMLFMGLDGMCSCPTCLAGFTWAYLHHLLASTPGLCQRLLIQHNVGYVVQQLKRLSQGLP
jgi:queuine tRNA-ribosyltransferase